MWTVEHNDRFGNDTKEIQNAKNNFKMCNIYYNENQHIASDINLIILLTLAYSQWLIYIKNKIMIILSMDYTESSKKWFNVQVLYFLV